MMTRSKLIVSMLCLMAMTVTTAVAQDIVARIPELQNDDSYMSLVRSDFNLRQKSDSLMALVRHIRSDMSSNVLKQDSLVQHRADSMMLILSEVESAIYAMRSQKIKLIDQINAIEQQYVLSALGNISAAQSAASSSSIFANSYFKSSLEAEDYAQLLEVNSQEKQASEYAESYVRNYSRIKSLYDKYVQAQTEAEAENIYDELSAVIDENRLLERQLSKVWTDIYDQKGYVYSYFLEKEGREDILEITANITSEATQEKLLSIDNCISEPLADYRLQKPIVLNYEVYVAKLLNLTQAIDSLSVASRRVRELDYRLPKLDIERRSFVTYQAIEFSARSPYNNSNPIPECIVYEYGTIYRILLGTFKYKQNVSIFRGASPLCIETLEDGRFSYYAGGFRTRTEAEKAVEVMKKKGFRNPQVVEWCDSYKTNITELGDTVSFRLLITGGVLDDMAREIINEMAPECQLSRVSEDSFIVGMFASRAMSERVARAIEKYDANLSATVEEIRPETDDEQE